MPGTAEPDRRHHRLTRGLALAVGLLAAGALLGALLDQPALASWGTAHPALHPLGAIALAAAAAALWRLGQGTPAGRNTCLALGALVFAVGLAAVLAALGGPGVDIALNAGLALTFLALAIVSLASDRRPAAVAGQWLLVTPAILAFMTLCGYAFGASEQTTFAGLRPMPLPAAFAVLLLSFAASSAREDRGLGAILHQPGPGGELVRRLLPFSLALPIGVGWLRLLGEQRGIYGREFGVSLMALTTAMLLCAAVIWTSLRLRGMERRQTRAEKQYRSLVQSIPGAVFRASIAPPWPILYVSDQVEAITGHPPTELIEGGRGWEDLIHPGDRVRVEDEVRQASRAGKPHDVRYRVRHAKGGTRWVQQQGLVVLDEADLPQFIEGVIFDVSDTRRLEHENARLATIVTSAGVAITSATLDGVITSWNREAERMLGYAAKDVLGTNLRDMTGPTGERPQFERARDAVLARGVQVIDAQPLWRKDGSQMAGRIIMAPIYGASGEVDGISTITIDISAQEEARLASEEARKAAEQSAQARSTFLANMSHEIRTPLNAIIGMSRLLEGTQLDPEQQESADTIRRSGQHLLTVINDILDFSKIESGQLELDPHVFSLEECIQGAIELAAPNAADKGVDLNVTIAEGTPQWFMGDEGRIRQVLLNLLSNAIKFTPHGEVNLEAASPAPAAGTRRALSVSVRDTGIGIPQDRMSRLFRSFSQVDASTTRRHGGTGLGLAISKQLIERMGGQIGVESHVGKGSRFFFTIPLDEASAPKGSELDVPAMLQGLRLLVVDDKEANRRLYQVQAERWGLRVRAAGNAEQALEWFRKGDPFDLVLLDHFMPGMDGLQLAKALRALPSGVSVPLILSSSMRSRVRAEEGAVDFSSIISKPAKMSDLLNAIVKAASRERPVTAIRSNSPAAPARPGLRLLVAEDNAINQRVILRMLANLGYKADVVDNGEKAVEAVLTHPYDLVFMDVHMPIMDGLEATRAVCTALPRERRPRIVALTAEALAGDRERCIAAGMDGYLSKPIDPDALAGELSGAASGPGKGGLPHLDHMADAMGGDWAFAKEMAAMFQDEGPKLMGELEAAVKAGDKPTAQRSAHSLKSNAATVGGAALSEMCLKAEKTSPEDLAAVAAMLPAMRAELMSLCAALKDEVARSA